MPCTEPDGNEVAYLEQDPNSDWEREVSQHEAMLAATGECPWCGAEEDTFGPGLDGARYEAGRSVREAN